MTRIETYDYPDGRWRWRAIAVETGEIIGRGGRSHPTQAGALAEFYRLTDDPYQFAVRPSVIDYNLIAEGHHEPCSSHGCVVCDQDPIPL